jgi:dihydrofolate reductase
VSRWGTAEAQPVTAPPSPGLVDQCHLFVTPIIVGGGKQFLPNDVHLELELLDEHRFGNGVVHLRYHTRT